MSAPLIHAIDGGIFGHALCEEPTGDSTTNERDVTCSDCLDLIEDAEEDVLRRLLSRDWEPIGGVPSWWKGGEG